ncbi:hypothetical protein AAC387_Pa07g3168 [Persea americana]
MPSHVDVSFLQSRRRRRLCSLHISSTDGPMTLFTKPNDDGCGGGDDCNHDFHCSSGYQIQIYPSYQDEQLPTEQSHASHQKVIEFPSNRLMHRYSDVLKLCM